MGPLNKFIIAVFIFLIPVGLPVTATCLNYRNPLKGDLEISFGKTGGFTNIPVVYMINSKGDVFRMKTNDPVRINSVSRCVIRKLRRYISEMDFEHVEMNDPGNITNFITVSCEQYRNTVKWNDRTDNEKVKELYKELMKTVKP